MKTNQELEDVREELHQLITDKAPEEDILKKSQELDVLIYEIYKQSA